jgi:glyoxylase-like metal-dependent hydrolase (beta-lactamase superfamily II)
MATDEAYGRAVVLVGPDGGRYPDGNSLLVRGGEETVLVDPSLGIRDRRAELEAVDWCLASHCHEDHVAGLDLFAGRPFRLHDADAAGIESLDAFLEIYGFPPEIAEPFARVLTERFHYVPRSDAETFSEGAVFDLGGVRIRVLHTPGHTRGHCCFLIEDEAGEGPVLYLGDIDLSSFGPYYGDAWSDLEAFERSLARVRDVEARWYATFHHIGVLERPAFLERLERFGGVIASREQRLLEYLAEPHSLDEIAAHRFVYRPGDDVLFAEAVERRSMGQHLARLEREGGVEQSEPGRFRAAG